MKIHMIVGAICSMLLALAMIAPSAKADVSNQATQLTFQQSVRIPGKVLPPGTYWFTVPDVGAASELNTVKVTNADGTRVIALLNTETVDQAGFGQESDAKGVKWPSGKVVLTFAEGGKGEPLTLLDWYYPGKTDGHKFVYGEKREKQFSEEKHQTVAFAPGEKVTVGRSLASFQ